ncbi:unnamed protein product [Polarella glacialis]|nr:unnamed protein product [Polarella glacialis]
MELSPPKHPWVWNLLVPRREVPGEEALLCILCNHDHEKAPLFSEASSLCMFLMGLYALSEVELHYSYGESKLQDLAAIREGLKTAPPGLLRDLEPSLNSVMAECQGMRAVGLGWNKRQLARSAYLGLALMTALGKRSEMVGKNGRMWSLRSAIDKAQDLRCPRPRRPEFGRPELQEPASGGSSGSRQLPAAWRKPAAVQPEVLSASALKYADAWAQRHLRLGPGPGRAADGSRKREASPRKEVILQPRKRRRKAFEVWGKALPKSMPGRPALLGGRPLPKARPQPVPVPSGSVSSGFELKREEGKSPTEPEPENWEDRGQEEEADWDSEHKDVDAEGQHEDQVEAHSEAPDGGDAWQVGGSEVDDCPRVADLRSADEAEEEEEPESEEGECELTGVEMRGASKTLDEVLLIFRAHLKKVSGVKEECEDADDSDRRQEGREEEPETYHERPAPGRGERCMSSALQELIMKKTMMESWQFDPSRSAESLRFQKHLLQSVDVRQLRSTHEQISRTFRHGPHKGQLVSDLTQQLLAGDAKVEDIPPLLAVQLDGAYFAVFGNRRLKALKDYQEEIGRPVVITTVVYETEKNFQQVPPCILARFLHGSTSRSMGRVVTFR